MNEHMRFIALSAIFDAIKAGMPIAEAASAAVAAVEPLIDTHAHEGWVCLSPEYIESNLGNTATNFLAYLKEDHERYIEYRLRFNV